jgi:hypothetical protein
MILGKWSFASYNNTSILSLFAVVFQCTAADRRLKQARVEAAA